MQGVSIRVLAALTVAGALAFNAAQASTIWSFGTAGSPGTDTGFALGNARTFSAGTGSVTASAWSNTGAPAGTYAAGYLGRFTAGLGVCNAAEVSIAGGLGSCVADGGLRNQADNVSNHDVVLFVFDSEQVFDSLTVDPFGNVDSDLSFWVGTVTDGFTLAGLSLADLGGAGFGSQQDRFGAPAGGDPVTVALGGLRGNAILVGALTPANEDPDKFKIGSLETSPVPLPAAAVLFPAAFALIATRLRRRRGR